MQLSQAAGEAAAHLAPRAGRTSSPQEMKSDLEEHRLVGEGEVRQAGREQLRVEGAGF
jgi:hypothetical protein